nr:hypothetical protein [Tanacetum cinerariifolium]
GAVDQADAGQAVDGFGASVQQVEHEHVRNQVHRHRGVAQAANQFENGRLMAHRQGDVDLVQAPGTGIDHQAGETADHRHARLE